MYGIFTYIWLIYIVNVGKYRPYMDPLGSKVAVARFFFGVDDLYTLLETQFS